MAIENDYFVYYNEDTGKFNGEAINESGFRCLIMAYDKELGKITIVTNYFVMGD